MKELDVTEIRDFYLSVVDNDVYQATAVIFRTLKSRVFIVRRGVDRKLYCTASTNAMGIDVSWHRS